MMLRSLVVANLFVLAFAVVRAPSWQAFSVEFVGMAAFAEPILITTLAMLCFARPALQRLPYFLALTLLALFQLLLVWMAFRLSASLSLEPQTSSFPQVALLSLFVTAGVVAYFDLRARALEPAVAEARIQALQARIRPHFLYNSINAVLSL
ncbi:MAG TPA: histidine kinase, partial [Usitatibacter sp.]|nr:histidine kinase [Usitatibacter sp.]